MSEEKPHHPSIFIHILLILCSILITGRAQQTDKEVVLELKRFLQRNNDVTPGRYTEWNESDPSPCRWHGVSCDAGGRVAGIDLAASSISGGIFPNFFRLPGLARLDLSDNTISGPIPPELNQCSGLRYLNMSHNLIEGELNLTGMSSLETLDLTLNRFSGGIRSTFPAAMCSNLVTLNLSMNSLSGEITGCFDGCPNLKYLDLSSNAFVGEIWSGLSGLREFSVSENNLTGAVASETFFPSDCSLEVLDLSSNGLSGVFPDSISNCSKLRLLNLWGNRFTGLIPSGIGSLPELDTLFLGNNSFRRDIPEQLLDCSRLVFLDLSRNNFGGEIQEIFGRFATLKFVLLHSNSYTGGIQSSGILKLPKLARLDLSFNNFSGELPIEVAKMPNLKFLILAHNGFSGSIPPAYGSIASLQALDLSFNQLTGSIPPAIGNLTSLLWLMLANNQLSGEIPPEMGNCSSLLWLNLANNRLSGSIPPSLTEIGKDPDPTFEVNRREGAVPAGSGECLAMKRWLPAAYPPFSFVYTLMTRKTCRVTWDRLLKGSGILPVCLNSSSRVRTLAITGYLQLSGNQLSGEVPPEIGKMKNLSLLLLDQNRLSGLLPPEIGQLRLAVLNASSNSFSGGIPPELGDIMCLQCLDFSWNNFSGKFQASLNRLVELEKFNISYNPLLSDVIPATGQLPTFENDSFLGDPLISFSTSTARNNWPPGRSASGDRRESPRTVAFWVFFVLTIVFFVCGVLSLIFCLGVRSPVEPDPNVLLLDVLKRRSDAEAGSSSASMSSSLGPSSGTIKVFHLDKTAFTYADIVVATGNFSDNMVVGKGGFGVVYRGVLPDGRHVAVKKLQRRGGEGEREFRAEMEVLAGRDGGSGWPHPNLTALFGWCLSESEKLLVYEYMEGGSLEDVIADWARFGWERRVEVAVGVAQALVFLHHECRPAVVHRDVKASNVLLDGRGRARVTDFGLARVVSPGESHVSTIVAGTVGYVAPEYSHTWQATTRGDVYSFGVLAMELATGRRAVDGGEECLVDWARRVGREGWLGLTGAVVPVMMRVSAVRKEGEGEATDEVVAGLAEMCALLRVGMRCTTDTPQSRPDMREVLAMLIRISGGGGNGGGGGGGGGGLSQLQL